MSASDNKLTERGHFTFNNFLKIIIHIAKLCEKLCALCGYNPDSYRETAE